MKIRNEPAPDITYLGVECGATQSVALLVDAAGGLRQQVKAGAANVRLLDDAQLVRHFRFIRQAAGVPTALAIGMAGARTEEDRQRIRRAAAAVWPGVPCHATNDLETGLMAGEDSSFWGPGGEGRRKRPSDTARVLVLSGTGSCCYGRAANGRTVKVGGWGHILGDKGSGYDLGLRALQAVVHQYDREDRWPALGQRILRAAQLNEPEELVGWAQAAAKPEIAALAPEVFAAWNEGDRLAAELIEATAETLAADGAACARRIARRGAPVHFVLNGSILLKQPRFTAAVSRRLLRLWPKARIQPLRRESAWGAVALARQLACKVETPIPSGQIAAKPVMVDQVATAGEASLRGLTQSPTERRNPRSLKLDKLSLRRAIELMLSEDQKIPGALLRERRSIERAIALIVRSFRRNGRLFYAGAGTSGRLGVLDASECPPTFSVSPEMVQGIMAGGQRALWESIEGAEDDPVAGGAAVAGRGVLGRDVVVGIAASGRTPFVWGALREARRRGARTVLLCFNPHVEVPAGERPDVVIAADVGPEVLTGSTRLKAGTATKLVLNLFTTLAMVQLGKVVSNLMVDVKASNAKLRDRATRIVRELSGADYQNAQAALEKSDWDVKRAWKRLGSSVS